MRASGVQGVQGVSEGGNGDSGDVEGKEADAEAEDGDVGVWRRSRSTCAAACGVGGLARRLSRCLTSGGAGMLTGAEAKSSRPRSCLDMQLARNGEATDDNDDDEDEDDADDDVIGGVCKGAVR